MIDNNNKFTVMVDEVTTCIAALKTHKADGKCVTDSNHFIYASHKFKVFFSLLLNPMFVHGHTAEDLLFAVLSFIPKDLHGNLAVLDNYRGIALCSAICKIIDNLILHRYRSSLRSCDKKIAYNIHVHWRC